MLSLSLIVKFIFDSLCLPRAANILQIADVALQVVFLLFLLCFWPLFRLVPAVVLTLEMSAYNENNSISSPGLLG